MVKTCITYEFIRIHLLWCFRLGEFPPPFLLIRIQRLSRLQKNLTFPIFIQSKILERKNNKFSNEYSHKYMDAPATSDVRVHFLCALKFLAPS